MSLSSTDESTQSTLTWSNGRRMLSPGPSRRTLDGMTPMAMQLDFERRSAKFLKTLP